MDADISAEERLRKVREIFTCMRMMKKEMNENGAERAGWDPDRDTA